MDSKNAFVHTLQAVHVSNGDKSCTKVDVSMRCDLKPRSNFIPILGETNYCEFKNTLDHTILGVHVSNGDNAPRMGIKVAPRLMYLRCDLKPCCKFYGHGWCIIPIWYMYSLYCVIHSISESTTVCFPLKMKYYAQYVDSRLPSLNHLKSWF